MIRIIVAGGGIAGSAAAIAWRRCGADVLVLERRGAEDRADGGIQIGPNGARILADLGAADALDACAVEPEFAVFRHFRTGVPHLTVPLKTMCRRRYGAPYLHVRRNALVRILHALVERSGATLRRNAHVVGWRRDGDRVKVAMQDGTSFHGDLLIGADGAGSRVRAVLFGRQADPRPSGLVARRGVAAADIVPCGSIGFDVDVWVGPGRHVVCYRPSPDGTLGFVAVARGDRVARADGTTFPKDAFRGWDPVVETLLASGNLRPEESLPAYDPLSTWHRNGVVLIGDARRPLAPFTAQGASMALEDAYALARAWATARGDATTALRAYEAERMPRVRAAALHARINGLLYHADGLGTETMRRILFSAARLFPSAVMKRLDAAYGALSTIPPPAVDAAYE